MPQPLHKHIVECVNQIGEHRHIKLLAKIWSVIIAVLVIVELFLSLDVNLKSLLQPQANKDTPPPWLKELPEKTAAVTVDKIKPMLASSEPVQPYSEIRLTADGDESGQSAVLTPSSSLYYSEKTPTPEMERTSRVQAMRKAADAWTHRKGYEAPDFLRVKHAITDDDRQHFTSSDTQAWQALDQAETLLKWKDVGLNAQTMHELPIKVMRDYSQEGLAPTVDAMVTALGIAGFHITESDADAALFIDIEDLKQSYNLDNQVHTWVAETSFRMNVTWIGGDKLTPLLQSFSEKSSGKDAETALRESLDTATNKARETMLSYAKGMNSTISEPVAHMEN